VSRYELQTEKRVPDPFFETAQRPVFDNDQFMIFDVSIKPTIETLCNAEFSKKYIKWYPLIAACSYIRAKRDDPYSAEYIIPQLFTQWVRSQNEDAVVGIKYFSCKSVYASDLGNNYVFPTMGIPYQARKTITGYCARLSHRFKLTAPRFIMEYENISSCKKVLDEDLILDYIEGYNAGEKEEIEGEYTIPEGASAIGAFAFYNCSSMTNIAIPDSVTSIGERAFYNCRSLTDITIPDSVTSIGNGAFYNCSSMTNITIPDSVTSIGNEVFSSCRSLTDITVNSLNEYYTSIDGILYNKNKTRLVCYPVGKKQTSFTIPSNVTSIGDFAFFDCSLLTRITIPDSVTNIGSFTFFDCSSLTSINIPNSVTSIDNFAFYNCNSLTGITIPDSMTSIGDSAFSGCSSLTRITIPDSVTSIGNGAFFDCSSLTCITIPNSVTSIGEYAFHGCNSLTYITVNRSNEHYTSMDGILYNKNKTRLVCYPAGINQSSFAIPSDVTSIGDGAFSGCSSLTRITIPNCATSIGDGAFSGCSSLTSINIPDSVTSIGNGAFFDCSSLTRITIPDSVTSIGDGAFSGCSSLTSITIPNSVTSIGDDAFSHCRSLDTVYYPGMQEQAESLNIGSGNECLQNATWVYGSSGSES
jgi:hypothetical protein